MLLANTGHGSAPLIGQDRERQRVEEIMWPSLTIEGAHWSSWTRQHHLSHMYTVLLYHIIFPITCLQFLFSSTQWCSLWFSLKLQWWDAGRVLRDGFSRKWFIFCFLEGIIIIIWWIYQIQNSMRSHLGNLKHLRFWAGPNVAVHIPWSSSCSPSTCIPKGPEIPL